MLQSTTFYYAIFSQATLEKLKFRGVPEQRLVMFRNNLCNKQQSISIPVA